MSLFDPSSEKPRQVIYQHQADGCAIVVEEDDDRRYLHFDSYLQQSVLLLDNPERLALLYTRRMMTALVFVPQPQRALMIGLGGGSMAKFMMRHCPNTLLEVVELNPHIVSIAQRFFYLPDDPRLAIHIDDGGRFLAQTAATRGHYDLILVDAFDSKGMSDSVYATSFFAQCRALLPEQGLLAVNMTGQGGARFRRLLAILKECFADELLRFPIEGATNEIIFAFPGGVPWHRWPALTLGAQNLEQGTQEPFVEFLAILESKNRSLIRRLPGLFR